MSILENAVLQPHRSNLYSDDAKIREAAIEGMVACGEEAVPVLIETVLHPNVTAHSSEWTTDEAGINVIRNILAKEAAQAALLRLGRTALPTLLEYIPGKQARHRDVFIPILLNSDAPEAQEAVRDLLTEHAVLKSKRRFVTWIKVAISFVIYCGLFVLLPHYLSIQTPPYLSIMFQIIYQIGVSIFISHETARYALSDTLRKSIVKKFSQDSSIEWTGTMLLCLGDSMKDVQTVAEEALIQMLSQVKASDSGKIKPADMMNLINALSSRRPKLTLAILKALEQVGDERALPKVEALFRELKGASGQPKRKMREATGACLPYLRQRAELASQSRTLLRASCASHEEAQTVLLRPANAYSPTEASELLRAEV